MRYGWAMTTGRNANKQANRERMFAEREAPLRRRIATLEKELEDRDRTNLAQQAAHIETTRTMRMLIVANTSEELTKATSDLDQAKATIKTVEEENAKVRKSHDKMFRRVLDHFVSAHGWTGADAVQEVANMLGFQGYIADDLTIRSGATVEQAQRLDVARGIRSASSVKEQEKDFNRESRPW